MMITPRLLPGFKIGNTFISIDYDGHDGERRVKWRVFFDPSGSDKKLLKKSLMVDGFSCFNWSGIDLVFDQAVSVCSFLGAFAEASSYGPRSENWDLFPDSLRAWAVNYSDEISMMGLELEEVDLV